MSHAVQELLRESLSRRWVQYGLVEAVRPVTLRGSKEKEELIIINFQGERVYCKKEDFINRKLTSFNGFLHSRVPFVVKSVGEFTLVSRLEAIPRIVQEFMERVQEGDTVTGYVTGVTAGNLVFVDVQGLPCLIPPNEWDYKRVDNLREVLPIGTEVKAKVLSISKIDPVDKKLISEDEETNTESENEQEAGQGNKDTELEFGYRIRLSRKEMIDVERDKVWENIESHYNIGDRVGVTIAGTAKGFNSWYCELPMGITLIGNLTSTLRRKYNDYLPPGVKANAEIIAIDKEKRRGKVRIFKVEPTHSALMNHHAFGAF